MTHFPTFRKWFRRPIELVSVSVQTLDGLSRSQTKDERLLKTGSIQVAPWKISSLSESRSRRLTEFSLLQILLSAIVHEQDVPEALNAFANDNRSLTQFAIRRLADRLRSNPSLASSVESAPGLFRKDTIMAIRLGELRQAELDGSLVSSLESLVEDKRAELRLDRYRYGVINYGYYAVLTVVFPLVLTFISFFILPTIRKIEAEFELSTIESLSTANHWVELLEFIIPFAILLCPILFLLFVSERFRDRVSQWINHLTGFRFNTAGEISNEKLLSFAVQSTVPLQSTLAGIAKFHPDPDARNKFLIARNDMELGTPAWKALMASGLIAVSDEKYLLEQDQYSESSLEAQQYLFDSKFEVARLRAENWREKAAILTQLSITLFFGFLTLVVSYYLFAVIVSYSLKVPFYD